MSKIQNNQRWLSANRLFYSINGGIVVGFWVALATFIQPAWLHSQSGWTVPAGGLGFVFGTVGSSLLYRPKER